MKKNAVLFLVQFFFVVGLCTTLFAQENLEIINSYSIQGTRLSFLSINNFNQDLQDRFIWYPERETRELIKFDQTLKSKILFVPIPVTFSEDVCWDSKDNIWVSDSESRQLKLISVPGGKMIKEIAAPGNGPAGLTVFKGYLWNIDFQTKKLYQMNRLDGKIVKAYSIPGFAEGMTATDTSIFFIAQNQLHEFDDSKGLIKKSYSIPVNGAMGLAWDGAFFHISTFNDDQIFVYKTP